MCWGVPKHLKIPPLTMMPILVQRNSASSIRCEVSSTADDFCTEIFFTIYHMNLLASGSIPADGSSSKMIGGLPIMAIPTESFRLLPPDSADMALLRWGPKSSWSTTLSSKSSTT